MFLVKLLPKAFLVLGTKYGIDCPYLYFLGNQSGNTPIPWNSAFSFCVITNSGSREWQGNARAAGGELRNHRSVATYLNPPFLGKIAFYGARARVWGFFYQRQPMLPKTWRSGQVKALSRKRRSDHQDDLMQVQIQSQRQDLDWAKSLTLCLLSFRLSLSLWAKDYSPHVSLSVLPHPLDSIHDVGFPVRTLALPHTVPSSLPLAAKKW